MAKRNDKIEDIMIKSLQEDIENVGKDISPKKRDFSDPKTRNDIVKETYDFDSGFAAHEQQSRSKRQYSFFDYLTDVDDVYIRRKSSAVGKYAEQVHERYSAQYPLMDVVDLFRYVNSGNCMFSYEIYSLSTHHDFAATLWILDVLQKSMKMNQAMAYFPDPEELADIYCPPITDSCHEERTIKSMMYIVRNRDNVGDNVQRDAFFINEVTAKNETERVYEIHDPDDENITNRQRFDSIMALIHPAVRERVQKRFAEKMWEAFELILSACYPYREREVATLKKLKQSMLELMDFFEDRKKAAYAQRNNIIAPLANPQSGLDPFLSRDKNDPSIDRKLEFMSSAVDNQVEQAHKLNLEWTHIALMAGQADLILKDRDRKKEISEESAHKLTSLTVKNPYETCFALLYLLDSGSNLPWLYGQGLMVMAAAARELPWYYEDEDEDDIDFDDELDDDFEEEFEEASDGDSDVCEEADGFDDEEDEPDDEFGHGFSPEDHVPLDWIDEEAKLYEMRYDNHWNWPSYDELPESKYHRLNFAQTVFETSRTLFPRHIYMELGLGEDLEKSGFEKNQGKIMELLVTALDTVWSRESYSRRFDQGDETPADLSQEQAAREFDTMTADHEALKKQFVELKDTYHETHREKNKLAHKVTELSSENEALKHEIEELRSLLSKGQGMEENIPDAEEPAARIPYTVNGRYVIFGGHESWAKAIKPLLQGDSVRFISPHTRPDASLIRHADTVFIQNNAISHADYYKIINIVRRENIPVEYFQFASAEKCAEQLAKYDMGSGL